MNLENKNISVTALSVSTYPPESKATVAVTEEVLEGIFKTIGTFEIKIDQAYHSMSDPALLNEIHERLVLIPD